MGRTACTEPQCLYKGALYIFTFLLYWKSRQIHIFQNNNSNGDSRTFKKREALVPSLKCYDQGGNIQHGKYINGMENRKYVNHTSHIKDCNQSNN